MGDKVLGYGGPSGPKRKCSGRPRKSGGVNGRTKRRRVNEHALEVLSEWCSTPRFDETNEVEQHLGVSDLTGHVVGSHEDNDLASADLGSHKSILSDVDQGASEIQQETVGAACNSSLALEILEHFDCEICITCNCLECSIYVLTMMPVTADSHEEDTDSDNEPVLSAGELCTLVVKRDLVKVDMDHKLTRDSISALLVFLIKHSVAKIPNVPPGRHRHHGITNHINAYLTMHNCDEVTLDRSLDGVPIFKSSPVHLYPLTGSFDQSQEVFIVELYEGPKAPADNRRKKWFRCVTMVFSSRKTVNIKIRKCVCDALAKSLLLKIIGPTGYCSCIKCVVEGEHLNNSVVIYSQERGV
ncbi:hypothetical protein FOCC_FOCC005353 [Frankliniella occidentalis]|nr:hypothetical protein FOCC_FOCC005353 [Frankliniella occidentalis]